MTEKEIQSEISTWEYLASTLTQSHQQSVRMEIERKIMALKNLHEITTCSHPKESLVSYHDMSILCRKCHEVVYQTNNVQKYNRRLIELEVKYQIL